MLGKYATTTRFCEEPLKKEFCEALFLSFFFLKKIQKEPRWNCAKPFPSILLPLLMRQYSSLILEERLLAETKSITFFTCQLPFKASLIPYCRLAVILTTLTLYLEEWRQTDMEALMCSQSCRENLAAHANGSNRRLRTHQHTVRRTS